MQLKPLLKQILMNPALFDSIDEPDMIKPPVVYVVGAMRALGLGITDSTANDYLDAMGEQPYFPPNVSGWEGGLSWLNTDTALARFASSRRCSSGREDRGRAGETAAAAYARAYAAVGSPWLASGTQAAIQNVRQHGQRLQRRRTRPHARLALRALILAGPDAQVM